MSTQTETPLVTKTYILLDTMDANAPIYQTTPSGQREQIRKIPRHRPYMQVTFQDKKGVSKTIRYKANSNLIDMKEQVEKEKIDANAKFTQTERDNLWFKFGVLTTKNKNLQDFLEAHPEFEGFEGTCDDVKAPCYKLLDKGRDTKIKNDDIRKRVLAAGKIIDLDLDEAQGLLIKINGSFFETPKSVEDCQNMLMDFLDATDEKGLEMILSTETTVDEETTILIGKLINAEELVFEADGKINKKDKTGKFITVRDMSAEYALDERKRLFSDFLNTADGKALKNDLEKQLAAFEKKSIIKT